MLSLNLANIRTAHEHFDRVYQPGQLPVDPSFKVASPVALAFDIFKDKDHFHLVGAVKTTLELPCSRCLEPFALPVDAAFDLRYHPLAENTGEGEREVQEDDLTTAFYTHDELDLDHLMKEQFHLALPMKPLCGEQCKGLCQQCGANLNLGPCGCATAWEDPRLAALKTLKHRN